jgi:hypothetical protein
MVATLLLSKSRSKQVNTEQITKESAANADVRFSDPTWSSNLATVGTFAGSKDAVLRIRNGKPIAADTGDQGGGQN